VCHLTILSPAAQRGACQEARACNGDWYTVGTIRTSGRDELSSEKAFLAAKVAAQHRQQDRHLQRKDVLAIYRGRGDEMYGGRSHMHNPPATYTNGAQLPHHDRRYPNARRKDDDDP
jgi:hypothetical protein